MEGYSKYTALHYVQHSTYGSSIMTTQLFCLASIRLCQRKLHNLKKKKSCQRRKKRREFFTPGKKFAFCSRVEDINFFSFVADFSVLTDLSAAEAMHCAVVECTSTSMSIFHVGNKTRFVWVSCTSWLHLSRVEWTRFTEREREVLLFSTLFKRREERVCKSVLPRKSLILPSREWRRSRENKAWWANGAAERRLTHCAWQKRESGKSALPCACKYVHSKGIRRRMCMDYYCAYMLQITYVQVRRILIHERRYTHASRSAVTK